MRINAKHIVAAVFVPHCVNGGARCRLCRSGAARASDSRLFGSGAAPISGSRNCQTPGICRSGTRACRGLRTRGPRHRKMPRLLFALRLFPCFDDLSACQPTEFAYIDVAGNASGSLHAMRIEIVTGTAKRREPNCGPVRGVLQNGFTVELPLFLISQAKHNGVPR